jgi:hypothetical protein
MNIFTAYRQFVRDYLDAGTLIRHGMEQQVDSNGDRGGQIFII